MDRLALPNRSSHEATRKVTIQAQLSKTEREDGHTQSMNILCPKEKVATWLKAKSNTQPGPLDQ